LFTLITWLTTGEFEAFTPHSPPLRRPRTWLRESPRAIGSEFKLPSSAAYDFAVCQETSS